MTRQTSRGFSDNAFVGIVNKLAVTLLDVPVVGSLVRRGMVEIRYVGRKSGKTIELPVGFRRSGEEMVIPVGLPDRKTWWRNFRGEGAPITLVGLDGRDRTGHAVAAEGSGGVSVRVRLDA